MLALFRPLLCLFLYLQLSHSTINEPLTNLLVAPRNTSLFEFGSKWQVLGPFQIGTREATWGADPLEYVGGFRNLTYDPKATFRSSLPINGTAKWNVTEAVKAFNSTTSANVSLSIGYSNVDWDFLKVVYGWTAVQYQAWARGELIVHGNETQSVILYTDAILEFWVDGQHYFGGDFYSYRKAPAVLHLSPGSHKIDLRLVRDVRAFGGILEPTIDVVVEVRQANDTLELAKPGILMSDVVDGRLPSSVGAVYLRNTGREDVEVLSVRSVNVRSSFSFAGQELDTQKLVGDDFEIVDTDEPKNTDSQANASLGILIVAGQTRSVVFNITLPNHNASALAYNIVFKNIGDTKQRTLYVSQNTKQGSIYRSHKVTFLHPGGMASYSMLRPPAKNASCRSDQTELPVLLALHGAGLEAEDPMVPAALNEVSDLCAWVLFPTGVTPWSGDDWHNWGFADVEAAIEAIPSWIEQSHWKGPGVDVNRWIVSGHSNGGQGTWYAATHRPDKVLAAAPVSGYASIQKYVSYELWQPADPRRTAIVSASLNSYRHEMLVANLHGIPIQQQHGQIDDNVPAYNSRFLGQQLSLAGANSSYNEVPGQNHYWDGVMVTLPLKDFYYTQTTSEEALPRKLQEFTIVVGDPGDMGSKGGIKVLHLMDPGQYGRVEVQGRIIQTTNVESLDFNPVLWDGQVTINGQTLVIEATASDPAASVVTTNDNGQWKIVTTNEASMSDRRTGRQLGFMTAILRSRGPFHIRYIGGAVTQRVALQISRNMHQYFQADSVILPVGDRRHSNYSGNVVTIVSSTTTPQSSDFPIQVGEEKLTIRSQDGRVQEFGEQATGAAYLRPLDNGGLELLIWGAHGEGLRQAARIVPMLAGIGQPDFVIFGRSAKWRGIEGVLAMGFFDSQWHVTGSSVT